MGGTWKGASVSEGTCVYLWPADSCGCVAKAFIVLQSSYTPVKINIYFYKKKVYQLSQRKVYFSFKQQKILEETKLGYMTLCFSIVVYNSGWI